MSWTRAFRRRVRTCARADHPGASCSLAAPQHPLSLAPPVMPTLRSRGALAGSPSTLNSAAFNLNGVRWKASGTHRNRVGLSAKVSRHRSQWRSTSVVADSPTTSGAHVGNYYSERARLTNAIVKWGRKWGRARKFRELPNKNNWLKRVLAVREGDQSPLWRKGLLASKNLRPKSRPKRRGAAGREGRRSSS